MKILLACLAAFWLAFGCSKNSGNIQPREESAAPESATSGPAVNEPKDYQVYSDFLREKYGDTVMRIDPMTNGLEPNFEERKKYFQETSRLLTEPLYSDFERRNDRRYLLEPKFSVRVVLTQPWGISFSRVGYSSDGKLALVYVVHDCGDFGCGDGIAYFLALENGHWKIKEKMTLWIT